MYQRFKKVTLAFP